MIIVFLATAQIWLKYTRPIPTLRVFSDKFQLLKIWHIFNGFKNYVAENLTFNGYLNLAAIITQLKATYINLLKNFAQNLFRRLR